MDDLVRAKEDQQQQKSSTIDAVAAKLLPRQKRGPEKKENPRSEKISCRLTKKEKSLGEEFCKERGISEAKLLRACYLAVITHTPNDHLNDVVNTLLPLDEMDLSPDQQEIIKAKAKGILKKSTMLLLFILLGCAAAPLVFKYAYGLYENGRQLILHEDEQCIWKPGQIGCDVYGPR